MAVTGAIFKALEFDGESSRNYGVYISGEAVYNAPAREVEMITIAGRNGQLALDKGHFENIEVTYHGGIFADNEYDFARAVSDFRNMLVSKKGYCRLADEYNDDEYRLAIYKSGLEVTPAMLKAGEFSITFDCMPQRFLMSGEAPINVSSGDVILNPTRFEAKPMLEVEGYGTINIGDNSIIIENATIGDIRIANSSSGARNVRFALDTSALNAGDIITIEKVSATQSLGLKTGASVTSSHISSMTMDSGTINSSATVRTMATPPIALEYGTAKSGYYELHIILDRYVINGTTYTQEGVSSRIGYNYDGASSLLFYVAQYAAEHDPFDYSTDSITASSVIANSSQSALGHPTYIDFDIGEAWHEDSGSVVSLNNTVQIPANLPTLAVGNNLIAYDSTITDLKLIPRWWIV